jgi:hypothetical protein
VSLCPAVPWFPSGRPSVLVEVHAIPHTTRVPRQEFIVPHFNFGRKLFEPLGVAESADHVVLRDLSDTGFKFFYPGMAARLKERQEAAGNEETPFPRSCHV